MKSALGDLSYCMNVHAYQDLAGIMNALKTVTLPLRERLAPDKPFGLGIWIPNTTLDEDLSELENFLQKENLYVFTINGFPYGRFHGEAVKHTVYRPDWSTKERLEYTISLVDFLANQIAEGEVGTISTVPVAYRKELPPLAVNHLLEINDYCRKVYRKSNKKILICLEPEPDCYIENTKETIQFFERLRLHDSRIDEHLAVCFDTCHISLQGEHPASSLKALNAAGIKVGKVQLSAALGFHYNANKIQELVPFDEPVYLHQTRIFENDTLVKHFPDLSPALQHADEYPYTWKIHYHIPLHRKPKDSFFSTIDELDQDFWQTAKQLCPHFEVETYTFDVLPDAHESLEDSIFNELKWVEAQTEAYLK